MRLLPFLAGLCIGALLPCAAMAQSTATTALDPALVKIARETVAQMQGDRAAMLSAMAAPMVGMMQQIGVKEPDKAQVLVKEVVTPSTTTSYSTFRPGASPRCSARTTCRRSEHSMPRLLARSWSPSSRSSRRSS